MLSNAQKRVIRILAEAGDHGAFLFGKDRQSLATLKVRRYVVVDDEGRAFITDKGAAMAEYLNEQRTAQQLSNTNN